MGTDGTDGTNGTDGPMVPTLAHTHDPYGYTTLMGPKAF